ncbi:hypothetical protein EYC84_002526 [Monilinia fructicola]|uniref:Uncharacterized protein n=1 Tax=Monilinia fructicola TaxID=38448 RepID=A0A5M9JL33_MONFR|nr:hypothetical protein EYC84_002526 [Monilinia fructicola]
MARHGDDSYDLLQNPGPRRAETFPVRFNETPSRIPEIGVYRRRTREQRYTGERFPPRGTVIDKDETHHLYNDQRTAQFPRRTLSPSPARPEFSRARSRSPSLTSIERRRANESTYNDIVHQSTAYYNAGPSPEYIIRDRTGERYTSAGAAARSSPYYTRHARRSRSNSRNRYRYSRSRSSSHGRVHNLNSYDVRHGGLAGQTMEFDFEIVYARSENTQDSSSGRFEEVPLPPLQPHSSSTVPCPKIDRIIKSHYTGDGMMGGMHSVEFSVAAGQATSAGRMPLPLFNFIRFEDSSMDFDGFQSGILNLDGLKENERFAISKLMERVKRRYDKTLQVSSRIKIRRMIPKLLQEPIRNETPVPASRSRKLVWLCLPYFSLQKYTSSDVKSSSHPPQTLLQTRQSMTPKERDLKQAAWFLILDDSFIISCAGLSTAQLIDNSVSIVPYRNKNPVSPMRTLLVSSSGSTLWSFPLEECKTWIVRNLNVIFHLELYSNQCYFRIFVKHFLELWPLGFEFSYNESTITPSDWPRIFKQAERSRVDLQLKSRHQNTKEEGASNQSNVNIADSNAPTPDCNQKNFDSQSSHPSKATKTLLLNEFHIFSWMNTHIEVPDSSKTARDSSTPNFKAGVNEILLQKDLQEIDDYLLQATSLRERFAYKASPRHTRKQFYDVLAEVESKVQVDQSLQTTYELQVELANAAEAVFGFFLSPQQSGPTIEKYWGPLYDIILEFDIDADPINREHQGRITDLKQEIAVILETLETQRAILDDAQNAQLRPHFQDGRLNRVVHAPKYEYRPSTFVEPHTRNTMSETPINHPEYYEVDLGIRTPSPPKNQSSPDNSRGVQGLLFRESLALIEERIKVFHDINDRATYLEDWNLRSIDTNKDRQETAIYAFTIVTIIFLPLSTVASILGMNTNDVRNMELTQWLFWVIAIPLTLIIIGLVLIWSDEWHNFRSAFSNLWGKGTKRRHVRLPEDYARMEPMTGLSIAPKARASGIYPGYYPPRPGPMPRLRRPSALFAGREYAPGGY